ncbi:MAG: hypothetical protein AAFR52_01365 [Pseudomonadota bacterium]
MTQSGLLTKQGERYEFTFDELRLLVRGEYPEWVLAAAAEIIADTEKLRIDAEIDQVTMLASMDEADEMDADDLRFLAENRFEAVPHCTVSLGDIDYRWVASAGRPDGDKRKPPVDRVHKVMLGGAGSDPA